MRLIECIEVIFVEDFLFRTRAIPVTDFAMRIFGFEQMGKVRTKRSHARATANIDSFFLRWLEMKITKGTDRGNGIAGLETEDVSGTDSRRAILPRRWRGDTHIETQGLLRRGITRELVVVATSRFRITRDKIKDVLGFPNFRVGLRDIEIEKLYLVVGRNI